MTQDAALEGDTHWEQGFGGFLVDPTRMAWLYDNLTPQQPSRIIHIDEITNSTQAIELNTYSKEMVVNGHHLTSLA